MNNYPHTVIVRHPNENPRKCSVLPLRGRSDVIFLSYPVQERPPLEGYVRLAAEGPALSMRTPVPACCCWMAAGAGPER